MTDKNLFMKHNIQECRQLQKIYHTCNQNPEGEERDKETEAVFEADKPSKLMSGTKLYI